VHVHERLREDFFHPFSNSFAQFRVVEAPAEQVPPHISTEIPQVPQFPVNHPVLFAASSVSPAFREKKKHHRSTWSCSKHQEFFFMNENLCESLCS
jgi:hypothetical protein